MIIGIGTDLVEIVRINRNLHQYGQRFLDRLFTQAEQEQGAIRQNPSAHYAKRFAAKEALVKALGTGFAQGISWLDMTVSNSTTGQPLIKCENRVQERLQTLMPPQHFPILHLSLSDTHTQAFALVVIEARLEP